MTDPDSNQWMLTAFPTAQVRPKTADTGAILSTSEDGDFVTLRKIRKAKQEEKEGEAQRRISELVNSIKDLKWLDECLDGEVLGDSSEDKLAFFNAIRCGSLDIVKGTLDSLKIDLNKLTLDNTNNQLALHYALEENQIEIAKYLIEIFDIDHLCANYNVNVKNLTAKKNALQRITELKDVELAKFFLSKLPEERRKTIILQEFPLDIPGQRPRTFTSYHLAAYFGSKELTELYLSQGIDINCTNSKGDSALLWATRWNHTEVMESLLSAGANPNLDNDKGSTAIHWAVRYGHIEAVSILTKDKNVILNTKRKLGLITPIILGSALGYAHIVELLIESGADVNFEIRGDERPIHHAAKEGHEDVLRILINKGARLNEVDARGDTALFLAIKYDHPIAAHILVEAGSDMCHKNREGMDIWSYALFTKSNMCLETLVYSIQKVINENRSACIDNVKTLFTTRSPVFQAAAINACDKLEFLEKLNVDLKSTDKNGNTLLHYAALLNCHAVVTAFADQVGVNTQNRYRETGLHLAASAGCYDTIKALLNSKAKANIKNNKGRTALHVAALSRKTSAEIMKLLVEYMIKTHSWDSLNEKDKEQRSALHIAALKGRPDVIWECRYLNCKDLDQDGNTPFHLAVRPDQHEAFDTMLDIYEFAKRDANLDQKNNEKETPLFFVVLEGFFDCVKRLISYGIDLRMQDQNDNTILHRLVEVSVMDTKNLENYLEMFSLLIEKSVESWCIRKGLDFPSNDPERLLNYGYVAKMELISEIRNQDGLSVYDLAYRTAAMEVLGILMTLKNVTQFSIKDNVYFDITYVTPMTNNSLNSFCGGEKVVAHASCIDWLLTVEDTKQAARLLDIPPLKVIEDIYARTCTWVYFMLMALHFIYMVVISINAHLLLKHLQLERRNTSVSIKMGQVESLLFFIATPSEPIVIAVFCLLSIFRFKVMQRTFKELLEADFLVYILKNYAPVILMFSFGTLIITWMFMFHYRAHRHDIVLGLTLCLGWLVCIIFTRGFKGVHHFWRMLKIMICRDVLRFLFIYIFVLLAFSFLLHVLLQASEHIAKSYPDPFQTIFVTFNLMIGMGELFDDDFNRAFGSSDRSAILYKLVYGIYITLSTIILLNLLIAMMNDSYQSIRAHESLSWRIDSMKLAIQIEKFFPWSTVLLSSRILMKRNCMALGNIERWYVRIPRNKLVKYERKKLDNQLIKLLRSQAASLSSPQS